jgi:hypothetical protein
MPTTATSTNQPSNHAIAHSMADLLSPKQYNAILSIARSKGLNADKECKALHGCEPQELTRRAASQLIDALKSGRAGEMAKVETSRDLMEYENAVDAGTFTGSYGEWVELY